MESHTRTLTRQIIMSFFHSFFFFSLSSCNFLFDLGKKKTSDERCEELTGTKKKSHSFFFIFLTIFVCVFFRTAVNGKDMILLCVQTDCLSPIARFEIIFLRVSLKEFSIVFLYSVFVRCFDDSTLNRTHEKSPVSEVTFHTIFSLCVQFHWELKKKSKEMKEEKSHKHRKMSFSLLFAKKIALVSSSLRFNCQYLSHARNFIFGISFDAISYRLSFFIAIYFQNKKKRKKYTRAATQIFNWIVLCVIYFSLSHFFFHWFHQINQNN